MEKYNGRIWSRPGKTWLLKQQDSGRRKKTLSEGTMDDFESLDLFAEGTERAERTEEMEETKETEAMEETEGTEETQGISSGEVKPDVSLNSLGTESEMNEGDREVTARSGGREPAEAASNPWPYLAEFFELESSIRSGGGRINLIYQCRLCKNEGKTKIVKTNDSSRYNLVFNLAVFLPDN